MLVSTPRESENLHDDFILIWVDHMVKNWYFLCIFRILEEYLHNSGLDAPYWTAVLKALKVTVESFKEMDATLSKNLFGKSRDKDEHEKMVAFISVVKEKNSTAQQKHSENKLEGGSHPQQFECTPEDMLAFIKEWPIEDITIQEIQERLEFLLKIKKDVISKTKNHSLWIQSYLAHPLVIEYLMAFIKQVMSKPEEKMVDIIQLSQELIEIPEFPEISKEYPQLEKFTQWLYKPDTPTEVFLALNEITDIHSFICFLKSIVSIQKASQQTFSEINWTKIISEGVEKVRLIYQHTYIEILIIILTHPYRDLNSEQNIMLNSQPFSVEKLLDNFLKEEYFFCINSSNNEALQAYLLYVATANVQLVQLVLDLLDKFQLSTSPNILHCAREVLTNPSSICDIKSKLIQLFENAQ